MRLKIILPVLILSAAIIAAAVRIASKPDKLVSPEATNQQFSGTPSVNNTLARAVVRKPARPDFQPIVIPSTSDIPVDGTTSEQGQNQAVRTRISELDQMAMSGDPESLRAILSELENQDARVRMAAVDAAVQFKSLDAIPALKEAFAQSAALDEKVHIQKAIDFLSIAVSAQPETVGK